VVLVCALLALSSPGIAAPGHVIASRHNLSTGGTGTVRATLETQVCVFCHTPHNANPAPQLWNHQTNAAQTYTAYGSSSFDSGTLPGTFNTFSGRSAGQPTGSSRLCLSCHDGTIALGATLNNGTILLSGTAGGFVPVSSNLGTDLSNDHPVSFARATGDTQVRDPLPGDAVHLETGTGFVQCVSCHDPHLENADPTVRKFLVKGNARSAVCTSCHQKSGSGWAWSSSPHSTSTKTYTAANTGGTVGLGAHTGYSNVADNGCASCHRAHTAPQAQRLLKSVNQKNLCFQCHGASPVAAKNLATVFAKARTHPLETSTATILHDYAEVSSSPTNFSGARRHVDCVDCHNSHGVANAGSPGTGLHADRTNTIVSTSVLAGASGVEPATWPAALARSGSFPMTSPAQTGYAVSPSAAREYQICLKCHSSYAYGTLPPPSPSGGSQTDAASEFNPNNLSYHPVIGVPHLRVPASTLVAPWNQTINATRMYCSDCHGNNETTSASVPRGPHGSTNPYVLRFANATWSTTAPTLNQTTGLCYNCHSSSTIKSTNNVHGEGGHQGFPCQYCHVATPHGSFRPSLMALTKDRSPYNLGVAQLIRWQRASTPTGYSASSCYSACHEKHNNASYAPVTNANTYY
jgi:predicted CXXCH cytochrome family protein